MAPIAEERKLRFLGIAHGWAGIVYALLRWREATGGDVTGDPPTNSPALRPALRGRPALAACAAGPRSEVKRLRAELVQRQRWIRPSLAGRGARSWRRGLPRAGNRRGARRPGPDGERGRPLLRAHRSCVCPARPLPRKRRRVLAEERAQSHSPRTGPTAAGSPLALSLYKGALGTAVLAAELPSAPQRLQCRCSRPSAGRLPERADAPSSGTPNGADCEPRRRA